MKTYIVLGKEDLKELIKEIISEISAQKPDKVKVEKEEDKLFTSRVMKSKNR